MRIVSGSLKKLKETVRNRVESKAEELLAEVERERSKALKRAKKQALEARAIEMKKAEAEGERVRKEVLQMAMQEANKFRIETLGRLEKKLRDEIRGELLRFVNGETQIGKVKYQQLVKKAEALAKKAGAKLKKEKTSQGIILSSPELVIDLTVDSLLDKLGEINMGGEVK